MASYVTMSLEDKISLLTQLERSIGSVKTSQLGGGVRTEFDTTNTTPQREIQKLIESILSDPNFTSDHPLWDALQGARRGGSTQPYFV
jgi:hypothetical protein